MPLTLKTAPTVEPVAVADLKRYWGVDFGEDDDRISDCGKAARIWVEHFLGRALINRTYYLFLRSWPAGREIRLPYPPASSVSAITYTATTGTAYGTTMSSGDYTVDTSSEPGRVILDDDASWPTLYGDGVKDEVRIEYVAGMASTVALLGTAQKQHIMSAIVAVGRAYYENPSLLMDAQGYTNDAVQMMLWSDRFLGEVDGL